MYTIGQAEYQRKQHVWVVEFMNFSKVAMIYFDYKYCFQYNVIYVTN